MPSRRKNEGKGLVLVIEADNSYSVLIHLQWFTSCMDVLVPEVAIRLIMQTYDIDYRQVYYQ